MFLSPDSRLNQNPFGISTNFLPQTLLTLTNYFIMEKERTVNNLLGEVDIYRITKDQISKLIEIITREIESNTLKGISGVINTNGKFQLQLGIFKGNFEDGENRKTYTQTALSKAGIEAAPN